MKKFKPFIIIVFIIIFAILGMKYFASKKVEPKKNKVTEFKRFVQAKKVTYSTIKSNLEVTGRLSSLHKINITAEVQGRILPGNISLKNGTLFKKGDILFNIYNKEAVLNHKARVSRFLNSVALLLPDMKIDFSDNFKPWELFFEKINLNKDLPNLPKIGSLKEKVFLSSRNILGEYFQIKSEELKLKKYSVKAPFSGSIISVNLEVQSIANPGAVIAIVSRTDELELEVPLDVKYFNFVKKGDKVRVVINEKDDILDGVISRIANVIDPKTQSLTVFVNLKNAKSQPLYSGLYLKAIFSDIVFENVMELPRNAIFNRNTVFIIKNKRLKKAQIEIKKINEDTIIFSGLKSGIMVVSEALINAKEKSLVEIIKNKR